MNLRYDKSKPLSPNFINSIAINSTLGCNLSCVGCNSFSDMKIDDGFGFDERLSWIDNLSLFSARLGLPVYNWDILGGEPLLHDSHIEIAARIRRHYPESSIMVYSNGLLLANKSHLIDQYLDIGASLSVTLHDIPDKMKNKVISGVMQWTKRGVPIKVSSYDAGYDRNKERMWRQTVIYQGDKVYPHQHGDSDRAWFSCGLRDCLTLQDNKLFYCPIMALLPSLLHKTNQSQDQIWQKYLDYNPLDVLAADLHDVIEFFMSTPGHRCDMCPIADTRPSYVPAIESEHHLFDRAKWITKI